MFSKILIANRGEIACRIMRTAKRLGIHCIAVYSEADTKAKHVALADEAYLLGPAPSKDSYLKGDVILDIAKRSGAQAIHPGYGFLSENAKFAAACAKANIVFIGPPVKAIEAMGSKSAAKAIMAKAKVPLVPGYHAQAQDEKTLAKAADEIGYPVLLKASAGGGGKGMRVVENKKAFKENLAAAKREAKAGFGDDTMLIEKYLQQPRHVELQIFADQHGHVIHLFERDCSLQRRHQKVIEEAPAPGLSAATRQAMGAAAIKAAQAIDYVGAGTVEFLFDKNGDSNGQFYFMEMNTRLQVEHPVTEMITQQDLVEWQLRVANGESLPLQQDQLHMQGHAFEARIYAEDAAKDFLPSIGDLVYLKRPEEDKHIRIDTGVRQGDAVSMHYDPMIAKLITWDTNRDNALRRLAQALRQYHIIGVTTNIDFLSKLASHPAFIASTFDTSFIERHRKDLFNTPSPASDEVIALASLFVLLQQQQHVAQTAQDSGDPFSPWHSQDAWRMNFSGKQELHFLQGEIEHQVCTHYQPDSYQLAISHDEILAQDVTISGYFIADDTIHADLDGRQLNANVVAYKNEIHIIVHGEHACLHLRDDASLHAHDEEAVGRLSAPMPGTIVAIMAEPGTNVERGASLIVIEAMKMEHTIHAPGDGLVKDIHYQVGEQVAEGDELLAFELSES